MWFRDPCQGLAMRILIAVALSLALSATVVLESGCRSECLASCTGPLAEVTASAGVSSVEVCDSAGACTRQEFGAPAVNVLDHSFTIRVPDTGSSAVVTLHGYGADGAVLVSGEAESSFGKSECGCRGPAHFLVNPGRVGSHPS